jgi:hypothetical protein
MRKYDGRTVSYVVAAIVLVGMLLQASAQEKVKPEGTQRFGGGKYIKEESLFHFIHLYFHLIPFQSEWLCKAPHQRSRTGKEGDCRGKTERG